MIQFASKNKVYIDQRKASRHVPLKVNNRNIRTNVWNMFKVNNKDTRTMPADWEVTLPGMKFWQELSKKYTKANIRIF